MFDNKRKLPLSLSWFYDWFVVKEVVHPTYTSSVLCNKNIVLKLIIGAFEAAPHTQAFL